MSSWKLVKTGKKSAQENMELDALLLNNIEQDAPAILHVYDWASDSATYGYFLRPEEWINIEQAKRLGLQLARRPTGGGVVFHLWDCAFSLIVPSGHCRFSENTLDNYRYVNRAVLRAAELFLDKKREIGLICEDAPVITPSCTHFCMARPTKYDVVLDGKKIAGAAQRKTKKGFLHQGTVALKMPSRRYLEQIIPHGNGVLEAIYSQTFPLLGDGDDLEEGRSAFREALYEKLTEDVMQ